MLVFPVAFALVALLSLQLATGCVDVSNNWNQFKAKVGASSATVFCPFVIEKPATQTLEINDKTKDLVCAEPKQCTIQGAGRHLQISGSKAHVRITGFLFRDATDSVIRIESNAKLEIQECSFRNNYAPLNKVTRGSAIRAEPGTIVSVSSTRFLENKARLGGAIFHLGASLVLKDSIFKDNVAYRGGGVFVPKKSTGTHLAITNTNFVSNTATYNPSGAICIAAMDAIKTSNYKDSKGTDNGCNGVYDDGLNKCIGFVSTAPAPEPAPAPAPTPIAPAPTTPTEEFVLGELTKRFEGIRLSQGLTARVVANSGEFIDYKSNEAGSVRSSIPFHLNPDGAAVFGLKDGGYVYVSNSETPGNEGGVYGIEFDRHGNSRGYKELLAGKNRNCNGGRTPWNTWVSCEEFSAGQCHQVDPTGSKTAQKTVLGGSQGGFFEAMAYDDRSSSSHPTFYVTEDAGNGAIRRFRPDSSAPDGWDMLHGDGTLDYLEIVDDKTFRWTSSLTKGRQSAQDHFQYCEGIAHHDGILMFVSKSQQELFRLDLEQKTYTVETTKAMNLSGGGSFGNGPDHLLVDSGGTLYFTEDGGSSPGVFVYDGNKYRTLLEADDARFDGDETTGIAFSPDHKFLFVCIQEYGILFQVSRVDQQPFDGRRVLEWKYDLGRA